jgi:hypothetical protein
VIEGQTKERLGKMKLVERFGRRSVETLKEIEGTNKAYEIITMKRFSGDLATTVQEVSIENGFIVFSFGSFNKVLVNERKRCTKKAMIKQHKLGIKEFDSLLKGKKDEDN